MFKESYTEFKSFKDNKRIADFKNIELVLERKAPKRPTLFEFFMNNTIYNQAADEKYINGQHNNHRDMLLKISSFYNLGYDYVTLQGSDFAFPRKAFAQDKSRSLNDHGTITDWESFEQYKWPEPEDFDTTGFEVAAKELPDNMKIIAYLPGGVLENVINLTGFDNLCYMIADEPELVKEIFDHVGSCLKKCHEINMQYDCVGAGIVNDDWGFNSQTMLNVAQMREYVVPWHKKIVEVIHNSGRKAIMHSCGMLDEVMDDIIDDIGFDAKHSYEDKIRPVEEAYDKYGKRIATLGGIDVDFICRNTPEAVFNRAKQMLEKTAVNGGYALGSGNSIPEFVPTKHYLGMIAAAVLD